MLLLKTQNLNTFVIANLSTNTVWTDKEWGGGLVMLELL
jgi:hypothetical protein